MLIIHYILLVLIKPEVLILSVVIVAVFFFAYSSNLLQKAWLGSTLLTKTDPADLNQTDHKKESVSISSGDSDHINLQQNSHEDPKELYFKV